MPQMLLQMIGPMLGAVAGGQGPQGSSTTTSNEELIKQLTQSSQQSSGTKAFDVFDEAIEDPRFAAFRQGLLPKFEEEFDRVQQPIFGEGVKAGTLQDINEQFAGVSDAISQQGAARGQLGSGLMPQMELQAQLAGAGQRANFLGQLPLLEEQSRRQATAGLLQQGSQFAGRAPISTRRTGVEEFESFTDAEERMSRERTSQGFEDTNIKQPSLFSRLMSTTGGLLTQQFPAGGNPFSRGNQGFADPFGDQNLGFGQRGNFSIAIPDINFTPRPQIDFNQRGA
jgi:hypothetical protein